MNRRLLPWLLTIPLLISGEASLIANSARPAIAVIVPAATGSVHLDQDELAQIFRRRKLYWGDGKKVYAVNLPASHPLRESFSASVLKAQPEEMQQYWNDMYFHGIQPPYVLSSEAAVKRFVADTQGAIGYVSYCDFDKDKRIAIVLVIDGDGQVGKPNSAINCPGKN